MNPCATHSANPCKVCHYLRDEHQKAGLKHDERWWQLGHGDDWQRNVDELKRRGFFK